VKRLTAQEVSPRHGQAAGLVSRGAAALVDLGVVWLISAAIAFSLTLVQSVLDDDVRGLDLNGIAAAAAGSIVLLLYLWFSWAAPGRTVGQLLLGLRVRRVGGGRVGPLRALARAWMATYVFGLLLLVPLSPRGAAGWDVVLGTEVVYDWEKSVPRPL